MSVKIKIRIDSIGDKNYLKIPISMDFNSIGQYETVTDKFIEVETEKAINPIIDYEKVRFTPILYSEDFSNIVEADDMITKLNFLDDNDNMLLNSTYSDIGFVNDDILYSKSRFTNSFLKMNFYDTDVTTNQNLISQITIFSKVSAYDIIPLDEENGGLPKHVTDFPTKFILNNPIKKPKGFAEGYYIYHFKSEMTMPRELYMRASFNNASTGRATVFTSTTDILPITEIMDKLHIRYILKKTDGGYYYMLDKTYNNSTNITETSDGVTLNLYEIQVS